MEPSGSKPQLPCGTNCQIDESKSVIWLDLLPLEVCRDIAALVSSGLSNHPLLSLAESSHYQSVAVKAALNNNLSAFHESASVPSLTSWDDVMQNDIRSIDLRYVLDHTGVAQILRRPNLQRACITNHPDCFRAIKGSRSLRALCLCNATDHLVDVELVLEALHSLRLKELALECCCVHDFGACLLMSIVRHLRSPKLAVYCPTVTVLDIDCNVVPVASLWEIIWAFPRLCEILWYGRLAGLPYERVVEQFCKIDRVKLFRASVAELDIITAFGKNVSVLCFFEYEDNYLMLEDAKRLNACTRLTKLQAFLEHGAESGLTAIWNGLQSIALMWRVPNAVSRRPPFYHCYQPCPDFILSLSEIPRLSQVYLFNVMISRSQLIELLTALGPRLRSFALSTRGQGELLTERLNFVLQALAAHNRNVQYFHVQNDWNWSPYDAGCPFLADSPKRVSKDPLR